HGLRAREDDPVDTGMTPQRLARDLAGAGEIVEQARRQPGVAVHLVQLEPGPGRFLGGLVDDRVSRDQRRRRHPGRERQREIERRNAGEHAVGPEHVGIALDWRDLGHLTDEAVGVLNLLAIVVDQVGGLLGVTHRLEPALAYLEAHDGGELEFALADQAGGAAQRRDPRAPGRVGPRPLRLLGARDGCSRHASPCFLLTAFKAVACAVVKRVTIWSISCSVIMNGGATTTRSPLTPSACPTLGQTTSPASRAASANASTNLTARGNGARVALSSTNSMPASSPRPRTSPTWGSVLRPASRACSTRPSLALRSTSRSRLSSRTAANPAAHATGWNEKVWACRKLPEPRAMTSTMRSGAATADNGA